jgi:ADP-ribose pyrophosphatase YjhB (NUDIX family)
MGTREVSAALPRIEVRIQVVCYARGRILCARHEKRGRAYWVLPGGHLDPGETLWRAAVRELEEEAGITLHAGRLWAVGEFRGDGRHVVECTFFATRWNGDARVGRDPEGSAHPTTLVALEWLDRERFEAETFLPLPLARRLLDHWEEPEAPAVYLES